MPVTYTRATRYHVRVKTLLLLLLVPAVAFADKSYVDGHGEAWDCAKDATVSIDANDGVYTFKGACKSITINGNKNKLTIEGSTKLSINGNENKVDITSVEAVATTGNQNKVSIKKGAPKISNPGNNNSVAVEKTTK
jgi:hypothetical protein